MDYRYTLNAEEGHNMTIFTMATVSGFGYFNIVKLNNKVTNFRFVLLLTHWKHQAPHLRKYGN